jgi:alpha-glucosidase
MHRAHADGTPLIRPLFHDFPGDPHCFAEHDAMMVGPDVLFAPVVEPGATKKAQYLPAGPAGWIDYHAGTLHPAGEVATVAAPLGRPPLFIRIGAAVMLASETPVVKPHDAPARLLYVATDGGLGTGCGNHVEDDGETFAYRDGALLDLGIATAWDAAGITVTLTRRAGTWPLPDPSSLTVVAPGADGRPVTLRLA